jgi:CheY-like chemotaxis protein
MARARNILIVDDDLEFRGLLRGFLEEQGRHVFEAADGSVALAILRTMLPDLILLDLVMPVMDGWALRRELQKDPLLARVPVAVLSAVAKPNQDGFAHVLAKPLTPSNLLGLLRAIDEPAGLRPR